MLKVEAQQELQVVVEGTLLAVGVDPAVFVVGVPVYCFLLQVEAQ